MKATLLPLALVCLSISRFNALAAHEIAEIQMVPRLTIRSTVGSVNQLEYSTNLSQPNWATLTTLVVTQSPYWFVDIDAPPSPVRFYRVSLPQTNDPANQGMALIPAGSFTMGDTFNEGYPEERPTHTVYLSEFYMDTNLVTGALWQSVHDWAINHGYGFEGNGNSRAPNHPTLDVLWWDAIKWCNARSEKEGLVPCYYLNDSLTTMYRTGRPFTLSNSFVNWRATGYRLPTEAEWEKAARGGTGGLRFPWGNLITHSNANYYSSATLPYDVSPTRYYHPTFSDGLPPYNYTSPVGYFQPNGYGLYDMAGNVRQWCWDFVLPSYYASSPASDPHGPDALGSNRALRGGGFYTDARLLRVASRDSFSPYSLERIGLRCVRAR